MTKAVILKAIHALPMHEQMKIIEQVIHSLRLAAVVLPSGVVEGVNNKVTLTTRKSYGFQSFATFRIALFHALGNLPQPQATHRFW